MDSVPSRAETIRQRVATIRQRIAQAAERVGRSPEDITLLAAAKAKPAWMIRAAVEAGCSDIGENYVQEALARMSEMDAGGHTNIRWHFIGHLQTNKARDVVGRFERIHSLDRLRLARELSRRATAAGVDRVAVLVEVNLHDEATKSGVRPSDLAELLEACHGLERLEIRGLMAMPPPTPEPEDARPSFRRLAALARAHDLDELSMGMSSDFEVAIEEGATIVRVGTALFGPRLRPQGRPEP